MTEREISLFNLMLCQFQISTVMFTEVALLICYCIYYCLRSEGEDLCWKLRVHLLSSDGDLSDASWCGAISFLQLLFFL